MEVTLPITKSSRKFGYVIWNKFFEDEMKSLLKESNKVRLFFNETDFGEKNVDWKYHRISLVYNLTRHLPEKVGKFILNFSGKNILKVSCK